MRILSIIGLAIATVAANDIGVCQKNCGIDFGKCIIQTFDMKSCLQAEAACALDCLKNLQVAETHHHHGEHKKHHHQSVETKVESDIGVCQKNCGIDFGKCLIQTFDMKSCLQAEAACALDCLKGIAFVAKYDTPVVHKAQNKVGDVGVCQKNCGIDFGKCLVQTFDFESCLKAEAACALDCLKELVVEAKLTKPQVKDVGVCQKNCGIDFGKCLIQTFDMKSCL